MNMSYPKTKHWKALGGLIGYLKCKKKKVIIIRDPDVLKAVIFRYYNYITNKETRKSVDNKNVELDL